VVENLQEEYERLKKIWEDNKKKIGKIEKNKFASRTALDAEKNKYDKMLNYYKNLFKFIEKTPSLENTFNALVEKSKLIEVVELEDIEENE
jgi:hypothetical protein